MDEARDGFLDEGGIGVFIKSGLDFIDERFAGGGARFGIVFQFRLELGNAFFRCAEERDFCERGIAGDALGLSLEVADDRVEARVLGNDVKMTFGVGRELAAQLEGQDKVECVAAIDRGLNDPELFGMVLSEKEEGCGELFVASAEDHEDPNGLA